MPYFKNDKVNILYIHIPKTGGSSIENYFSKKYGIPLDKKSIFSDCNVKDIPAPAQHLPYRVIMFFYKDLNIELDNLKVIASVRNPYEKIISELFYSKLIDINSSPEYVEKVINVKMLTFVNNNYIDGGHYMHQHKFILDGDNQINKDIIIVKNEKLNEMMQQLGFTDFNEHANETNKNGKNYYKYLTKRSINIINQIYKLDFMIFNYKMIIFA